MKIVVACDSFKESMSALQACKAVERGIHKVDPGIHVECIPMADGGEGTSKVLNEFYQGKKVTCRHWMLMVEKLKRIIFVKRIWLS